MALLKKAVSWVESFLTWSVVLIFRHKFDSDIYRFNFPEIWYSPWNGDSAFATIYRAISNNTLVSKRKLYDLYCISKQYSEREGDYLEVGTLRGGTAALLATTAVGRDMVFWDNWGIPVERDGYFIEKAYSSMDDLDETKRLLDQVSPGVLGRCSFIDRPFPCNSMISGWTRPYSLIHFDIYDSTAFEAGIELMWPRLLNGGVFIVSAYGSISLDPLTKAVNAFANRHNDCFFLQSQSGLGLLIKRLDMDRVG